MLLVRTKVKPSGIHGLGLFAATEIKQGQRAWEFHPKIDQIYMRRFLETIPLCVAEQIESYSYANEEYPDALILCGDDARFMNFPTEGKSPNLILGGKLNGEYLLVAARDIAIGEELTVCVESDADAEHKISSSIQSKMKNPEPPLE